jgi:hypothetical protein
LPQDNIRQDIVAMREMPFARLTLTNPHPGCYALC